MYLKKIEIFGFKSFADKTVLNFERGITAVVGPNGCGKSNVLDAIRWVLGEQSIKELRGSSMEDVIFNGTEKKPGLGFAEVSLSFSNESRVLPVEYNEVVVTRRLFRSGESEYLLNRTPVRLKDIAELFMGTGIGAEAYSLVQQGKVDLVVSAKPEDRRFILDEAAGITKYKAKRKEALNKLKDTEDNLLRINDIITEVKRQIASMERQASKARRYKEEFDKLKNLELKLAKYELDQLAKEHLEIQSQLEELNNLETRLNGELKEFAELIQQEDSLLKELEDKINDVNTQSFKLDHQKDGDNRQIGFNEERIETLSLNETRILENKKSLWQRAEHQKQKTEDVKKNLGVLEESIKNNIKILEDKKERLNQIAQFFKEAKETIKKQEGKILGINSLQVNINNRLTDTMKEMQGALARKRRLDIEKVKITQEKEEVDRRLDHIHGQILSTNDEIDKTKSELAVENQILNEFNNQHCTLENAIDDLEKAKLFLISQKEFIEKLKIQYQDIPDPLIEGRLFTDSPPSQNHKGIIGKVKGVLAVDHSHRQALGIEPRGENSQLFEIICEAKFIELDPQLILTQIESLVKEIEGKIKQQDEIKPKIEEHQSLVTQIGIEIQNREKSLSIYEVQKNGIEEESNKLLEELELVKIELEETQFSLSKLKSGEDDLNKQMDNLNQEFISCQTIIRDRQEAITQVAQEREELLVAVAQFETEIASSEDKKNGYLENLKLLSETIEQELKETQRLEGELAESERKKQQLQSEIETLREGILKLKEEKQSLQNVILTFKKQEEEIANKINGLRSHMAAYQKDIDQIKNRKHQCQMTEQEISFKEKEIQDRLLQTYKIDWNDVLQDQKVFDTEAHPENQNSQTDTQSSHPDELKATIEQLKKRCEAFGSVNLVAIEEFDDLRNRFEFLTKQQSDLISAKESLHQTINKINRQTRQMFMDTFTKVSEEFRIYFRMLFGGGDAQLVMLDPENVLESGIEIIARPPGKKLQNIGLLSGGEKSLTAIALIFGVFKVNPSPFCVLDEIDAALDESNVGRFSYLLKDFSQIAQFIVITHNKKTIAASDVMYGITMEETGVSKIVSVKFVDDNEKKKVESEVVPVGV